jgi:predicted transposase YbfD/YdcC
MDLSILVGLRDNRRTDRGAIRYKFEDLILMMVISILAGMNTYSEIEEWCKYELKWLNEYLGSNYKTSPSDDTFRRILGNLDYKLFEEGIKNWLLKLNRNEGIQLILDGKSTRGSKNYANECIHTVNAYAKEYGLVFCGSASTGKGHEITGIKELLEIIPIKNNIISIDSIGCQKNICEKIVLNKGNYTIAVKSNQKSLFEGIKDEFLLQDKNIDWIETADKKNSCVIKRRYGFLDNCLPDYIKNGWRHIKNLVIENNYKDDVMVSTRYFISSLDDIQLISSSIRGHWAIENNLHWVLDVEFKDDDCKAFIKNSAQNFNIMRRLAFNLIQLVKTHKNTFKSIRMQFDKVYSFRTLILNNLKN